MGLRSGLPLLMFIIDLFSAVPLAMQIVSWYAMFALLKQNTHSTLIPMDSMQMLWGQILTS